MWQFGKGLVEVSMKHLLKVYIDMPSHIHLIYIYICIYIHIPVNTPLGWQCALNWRLADYVGLPRPGRWDYTDPCQRSGPCKGICIYIYIYIYWRNTLMSRIYHMRNNFIIHTMQKTNPYTFPEDLMALQRCLPWCRASPSRLVHASRSAQDHPAHTKQNIYIYI